MDDLALELEQWCSNEFDIKTGPYAYYKAREKTIGRYQDDQRVGTWIFWKNDLMLERSEYVGDQLTGVSTEWHENGELAAKGDYLDGDKHGTWMVYDDG